MVRYRSWNLTVIKHYYLCTELPTISFIKVSVRKAADTTREKVITRLLIKLAKIFIETVLTLYPDIQ